MCRHLCSNQYRGGNRMRQSQSPHYFYTNLLYLYFCRSLRCAGK